MTFIVVMAMVINLILIVWTWQSLGTIEKIQKVFFILIGMISMYAVTWFIFQIAKGGIYYENIEMQKGIQNILVAIFTGVNSIIVMPQIARIWDKIQEEQITKKVGMRKIVIITMIFVICLILEIGYMKDTQEGILKMYYAMK